MIHGLLRIDKPAGPTSAEVLDLIKKRWSEAISIPKRDLPKIGHAGTLDPFATGLLLVFIGNAVRLSEYFLKSNKTYVGTAILGVKTASGDLTSPIQRSCKVDSLSIEELQKAADRFVENEYFQTPPMYSAVKVKGKRLYDLARKGIEIERKAVLKKIHSFKILQVKGNTVLFETNVDSGTYIRTLTEDWAKSFGNIAALQSLRRITVGSLDLKDVVGFQQWLNDDRSFQAIESSKAFIPFNEILNPFPKVELTEELVPLFLNGNPKIIKKIRNLMPEKIDSRFVGVFFKKSLLGTLHVENDYYSIGKIFHPTSV